MLETYHARLSEEHAVRSQGGPRDEEWRNRQLLAVGPEERLSSRSAVPRCPEDSRFRGDVVVRRSMKTHDVVSVVRAHGSADEATGQTDAMGRPESCDGVLSRLQALPILVTAIL